MARGSSTDVSNDLLLPASKHHLTLEERKARGKAERDRVPRSSHSDLKDNPERPDPLDLLSADDADRIQTLLPIRYGRMIESPFAFFRGSAAIMAWDLNQTQRTDLTVQLSGDAHLSNFGFFASRERQQLFDMNDFDETIPGPCEFDVKRLAASAYIAAQEQGFGGNEALDISEATGRAYRKQIGEFAQMTTLEAWYHQVTAEDVIARMDNSQRRKVALKRVEKARSRDSRAAFQRMTNVVGGSRRIIENPPLVERLTDEEYATVVEPVLVKYRETLDVSSRHLFDQFQHIDASTRVGGVGSVGTRCFIIVFIGRDENDPLVLQLKQVSPSALASYVPPTGLKSEGERVVTGQQLIQGAPDIFLGWTKFAARREYYVRQLWDMKAAARIEEMSADILKQYAMACACNLARGHARSGDAVQLSSYLGKSHEFDKAIAQFAKKYADRNARDYERLTAAVKQGRIEVQRGV